MLWMVRMDHFSCFCNFNCDRRINKWDLFLQYVSEARDSTRQKSSDFGRYIVKTGRKKPIPLAYVYYDLISKTFASHQEEYVAVFL